MGGSKKNKKRGKGLQHRVSREKKSSTEVSSLSSKITNETNANIKVAKRKKKGKGLQHRISKEKVRVIASCPSQEESKEVEKSKINTSSPLLSQAEKIKISTVMSFTPRGTPVSDSRRLDDPITAMQYKRLGRTGLKVSRICLGCMSFGDPQWRNWVLPKDPGMQLVKSAWELGINFFDTANMYSDGVSEEILGAAVKEFSIPRDEIVIATKCFFGTKKNFYNKRKVSETSSTITTTSTTKATTRTSGAVENGIIVNCRGLSRKNIFEQCEASLKRLQMDYIDLYQIHRWDDETPIEETMKALHDLVQVGKVRYLGASTMYAWQFAKAQHVAKINGWTPFVSMQNLYNLIYREEEREMNPMCTDMGVGLIPWSPLARGFLTGRTTSARQKLEEEKMKKWIDDSSHEVLDCVRDMATKHKVTCAEIALAWVLSKEEITAPIVGVSKLEHLQSAVNSLKIQLSEDDIQILESKYKTREVQGWHGGTAKK